jgi:hypothetical protein
MIALQVPTNVSEGTNTSSFSLTPIALIAKCKPAVPFTTLIAYLDFVKFLIFFSNFSINLPPLGDTNEESIHSFKYFFFVTFYKIGFM